MDFFFTFLAWAPAPSGGGQAGSQGATPTILMFGAMFAIMYFLVLRPQQKRMKEHKALLSSVKRGDEVVLTGGMHGRVEKVDDTTLLVEIARNTIIKVEKGSVTSVTKSTDAS